MVVRRLVWLFLVGSLLLGIAVPVSAEERLPDFSEPMSDFYDALPDDLRQSLPQDLLTSNGPDPEVLAETMRSDAWVAQLREQILLDLPAAARLLGKILLLCILSAVIHLLAEAFGRGKLCEAVRVLAVLFTAILLIEEEMQILETVSACLQRFGIMVSALLPLLGVMFAAGGNTAVASSGFGGLLAVFAGMERLFSYLLCPMLAAAMGIAVSAALPIGRRLRGMLSCIKRVIALLLGLCGLLFSVVFGVQTLLAAGADSVAARTVKFAVGNAVPVIGGIMGDTVRTVGAGLEYLKDTVGFFGVLLTLFLVLPPILHLLLHRAVLLLGQSAADLLDCSAEVKLMGEFSTICGWLLALVCVCAAAFIFSLVLFVQITLSVAAV